MSKFDNLRRHEVAHVFEMHERGESNREIGRYLGRSHTAVGRVLGERQYYRRAKRWERLSTEERTRFVTELREKRRKEGREREWLKSPEIRAHVIHHLREKRWSPERIAETIGEFFPGKKLSAKAIYNFTAKVRLDLREYLPEQGESRRQRVMHRRGRFQVGVPQKRSIESRPRVVETREELGHFEADTIHSCKGGTGAVLTLRERVSRKRWYFLLPNLEASTVLPVLMLFFQRLPPPLRHTLTIDNGGEWAEAYYKLEKILPGFRVYFCHPYQAYERGAVENANRELRRFFPKGTDFGSITEEKLRFAESLINDWPMKCLKWKTADFVFNEALKRAA